MPKFDTTVSAASWVWRIQRDDDGPLRGEGTRDAFPYKALFALSMCNFSQAFCVTQLFPYGAAQVLYLLRSLHDDENRAGYYAGYISSAYFVGRCFGSYPLGVIGDRYARKPVLYLGLVSQIIFSVTFGMSRTLVEAIAFRFVLGMLNGIWTIAKTMVSEVCSKEQETAGMGIVVGSWGLGLTFGPALGGVLAGRGPSAYPFLWPNIVCAAIALMTVPLVYYYVPETVQPQPLSIRSNATHRASPHSVESLVGVEGGYDVEEKEGWVGEGAWGQGGEGDDVAHRHNFRGEQQGTGDLAASDKARVSRGVLERDVGGGCRGIPEGERENGDVAALHETSLPASEAERALKEHLDSRPQDSDLVFTSTCGSMTDTSEAGFKRDWGRMSTPTDDASVQGTSTYSPKEYAGTEKLCARPHSRGPLRWGLTLKDVDPEKPVVMWYESRQLLVAVCIYFLFSLFNIMADELFPLWAYSSYDKGGMSMSTSSIGQILSYSGLLLVAFQFFVFPWVAKRTGVVSLFRVGCLLNGPCFALTPIVRDVAQEYRFPTLLAFVLVPKILSNVCSSALSLIINRSVSTSQRSSANGLAGSLGSIGKSIGPASVSVMYAWSLHNGMAFPADYHLSFLVVGIVVLLCSIIAAAWIGAEPAAVKRERVASIDTAKA